MNEKSEKYVVVIGGANIDIGGTPNKQLIPADSNPGEITINYGGVGRNIAHNLCNLGVPVKFITAIGGDGLGRDMLKHCESIGMDISHVLKIPDETSSMYLYINNNNGDMNVAIDHMTICKKISPEYIESLADVINGAEAVVTDTNITKEAFMKLKDICKVPIYVDPVSTALAEKVKDGLDGIDTIKPNNLEAEYLTGMTIKTEADYKAAAKAILDMGVRRVFMSKGPEGMIAAGRDSNGNDHVYIIDEYPADVVCTTGAGDSATAAIVWASMVVADNKSLVTAAKAANVVAAMTIEVDPTNNPELSHQSVLSKLMSSDMKVRTL